MGTNTVGLVMTEIKDFFKVKSLISGAIQGCGDKGIYTPVSIIVATTSDLVQFSFSHNDDDRLLSVHFDCDSDGEDCGYLEGSKLILSLGCWGGSVEIMKTVLNALKEIGSVYIIENDSTDELKIFE